MRLNVRCLDLEAGGKTVVILNKEDADHIGVYALDRIIISYRNREITTIVNISESAIKRGEIAVYNEVKKELGLTDNIFVEVKRREELRSKIYIRRKIDGYKLSLDEIKEIVKDVVERKLNDLEIAAFVTSLHIRGLSTEEIANISKVMVNTGETLNLRKKIVADKHSLGGVPGDKTTLLLVPIVAASGLTIPKTSSKAITSPAGTADRASVLMPVNLDTSEIKRVVNKTNGCIAWGGSLNIAPADDLFIQIERPLTLDPLYIPSIMSKKKALGITHLVIDLPTGRGTKVKTIGEANEYARDFIEIGKRLNINVNCAITFGEQPIGTCIGPALEAREALEAITKLRPLDLIDKACSLAGVLFELTGKGNKHTAYRIIKSMKAAKKLREIIDAQGGNKRIKPDDIKIGDKRAIIYSKRSGKVMWIKNYEIAEIAKIAGAPKDLEAGIKLNVKIGSKVKQNQPLFTIYAKNSNKLNEAEKLAEETEPIIVIKDLNKEMLIKTFTKINNKIFFAIER